MTQYNNWSEIPVELQRKIAERFFYSDYTTDNTDAMVKAANGEIFQWAISQGLINKPEPKKVRIVDEDLFQFLMGAERYKKISFGEIIGWPPFWWRHDLRKSPLATLNPDGTYSEVKDEHALKALGE